MDVSAVKSYYFYERKRLSRKNKEKNKTFLYSTKKLLPLIIFEAFK